MKETPRGAVAFVPATAARPFAERWLGLTLPAEPCSSIDPETIVTAFLTPLAGGALIGASAALLLMANGRIAGISGILGGLLGPAARGPGLAGGVPRGLLAGPWLFRLCRAGGRKPASRRPGRCWSRQGSSSDSGRGSARAAPAGTESAGLARLSPRSVAAVATFMAAAIATVFLVRHGVAR